MSPLIRIENVSRAFGDVVALDSVSMEIRENEFFALLGPSGCGKTTLLRVSRASMRPTRVRCSSATRTCWPSRPTSAPST